MGRYRFKDSNNIYKRSMHPRNPLRILPNYTKLAIKHKNLREVCELRLNGKVYLDFQNESVLRALAKALLFEYFELHVEFAPGSLVPTLSLRLNYLLWLEDLLAPLKCTTVRGIDIGCGSSCIYSLLAAKKNQWSMLALESNGTNLSFARENVARNKLQTLISVHAQPDNEHIFQYYFDLDDSIKEFQFCLCNPPFFDSNLDNPFEANTRNPDRRPAPKSVRTGVAEELTCEGGEFSFVKRIIDESEHYKQRVLIFTSMVGAKANAVKLLKYLSSREIKNVCQTEFCQGRVTRWGIAWSFQDVNLKQQSTNKKT